MSSEGLRVPRSRGEGARQVLIESHLLEPGRAILREEDYLVLPLVPGARPPEGLGTIVTREFPPVPSSASSDYRDRLSGPPEFKARLPRSFDVVGDIVLVRIPEELEEHREKIGSALLEFVPGARIVGADRGVHGTERLRSVERIAGTGGWTTRHRENGIELTVNVEKAYFSPRLAREHDRVAQAVRPGERVYDLCCGVAPFAFTIARGGRAGAITAVDANPSAIELARSTARRYAFGSRVTLVEARLESFLPGAEPRELVVLNLPREGIKYLSSVARVIAPQGRLFYYEVTARAELDTRAKVVSDTLGTGADWRASDVHVVHPYSPSSDLVAFTFERGSR